MRKGTVVLSYILTSFRRDNWSPKGRFAFSQSVSRTYRMLIRISIGCFHILEFSTRNDPWTVIAI